MPTIRKIGNDTEIDRILNRDFVSIARSGYVEVGEENICLPVCYEQYEEKIRKFEVHDDDVFITGHPKTGTTWTEEMVWLMVNNLNYKKAAEEPIFVRSTQLELAALLDFKAMAESMDFNKTANDDNVNHDYLSDPFTFIEQSKRPRCIKTHLHWSLLPEQIQNSTKRPKIINVLRNPADVCVSLYYHSQSVENYKGTFENFCELFLAGRVCFGPFWKLILSYWQQRERQNILFIKYKEMKDDLPAVIRKVANFLGKSLTEVQTAKLAEHLSFESMKKNPSVNHEQVKKDLKKAGLSAADNDFIRSGKVGGYKSKMSPAIIERFEVWEKDNLAGTGLSLE